MHLNILTGEQRHLLNILSRFKKEFYMVGGSAIALHIGHRLSIDFDLFKNGNIHPKKIKDTFEQHKEQVKITLNKDGQLNLLCRNVKFTFLNFEWDIPHPVEVENYITIPTLLDLAAMKAFAMGMRSKWKDYVDLYFILKYHYSIDQVSGQARRFFADMFSEKLFRSQLNYFKGISFEEPIEFMPGFEVKEEEVKDFLNDVALTGF